MADRKSIAELRELLARQKDIVATCRSRHDEVKDSLPALHYCSTQELHDLNISHAACIEAISNVIHTQNALLAAYQARIDAHEAEKERMLAKLCSVGLDLTPDLLERLFAGDKSVVSMVRWAVERYEMMNGLTQSCGVSSWL